MSDPAPQPAPKPIPALPHYVWKLKPEVVRSLAFAAGVYALTFIANNDLSTWASWGHLAPAFLAGLLNAVITAGLAALGPGRFEA